MKREGRYKKAIAGYREKNPFVSNTELVYRILLEDIVEHNITPGSKLNQEQIAIDMDVSRTPVRDAFIKLEQEGFLVKGAQGYTVYEMQPGDYVSLLDVRISLENLAARLACSRILSSEKENIEKNLLESEQLLQKGRGKSWDDDFNIVDTQLTDKLFRALGNKDHEFHNLVIRAAHNKYLTETYEHIDPKIHFFRFSALSVNACTNMVERHKKIYEAISSRDEEQAESRMETHLKLTIKRALHY